MEKPRKHSSAYFGLVKIHAVHGEFLGVLQEHEIRLCWSHRPAKTTDSWRRTGKQLTKALLLLQRLLCMWACPLYTKRVNLTTLIEVQIDHLRAADWPVRTMQLHHLVLQLFRLTRGYLHLLAIVVTMHLRVVLAQLRLQGIGAQESQRDEGAGEAALQDVLPQLQAQVVPAGFEHVKHLLRASMFY